MSEELSKDSDRTDVVKVLDPKKNPTSVSASANPLLFNPLLNSGFFSFRYSSQELSSSNGKTRVRARQLRFEDGKLSTESFEGLTDANVYAQSVQNLQRLAMDSMNVFFQSFASMLSATHPPEDPD